MNSPIFTPPAVLVFAANDPSGGAGATADTLALASMGCHPLVVITGVTVQNTTGVEGVLAIDSDWVADQARAILEDIPVAAFKIGVTGSADNINAIAEVVSDYPDTPLILDPVLASARGDEFVDEEALSALKELLVPQTTILTPNVHELRALALCDDEPGVPDQEMVMRLIGGGTEYVLVTGTHAPTPEVVNSLYGERGLVRQDRWTRLAGSYHGSGCTLASAVAATIARGLAPEDAVREAQEFTYQTLVRGFRPGMGQYIPDRLFWARDDSEAADPASVSAP
jgi:hydroxymethylpyrimidine/phosphomethylpyrimidine kinase